MATVIPKRVDSSVFKTIKAFQTFIQKYGLTALVGTKEELIELLESVGYTKNRGSYVSQADVRIRRTDYTFFVPPYRNRNKVRITHKQLLALNVPIAEIRRLSYRNTQWQTWGDFVALVSKTLGVEQDVVRLALTASVDKTYTAGLAEPIPATYQRAKGRKCDIPKAEGMSMLYYKRLVQDLEKYPEACTFAKKYKPKTLAAALIDLYYDKVIDQAQYVYAFCFNTPLVINSERHARILAAAPVADILERLYNAKLIDISSLEEHRLEKYILALHESPEDRAVGIAREVGMYIPPYRKDPKSYALANVLIYKDVDPSLTLSEIPRASSYPELRDMLERYSDFAIYDASPIEEAIFPERYMYISELYDITKEPTVFIAKEGKVAFGTIDDYKTMSADDIRIEEDRDPTYGFLIKYKYYFGDQELSSVARAKLYATLNEYIVDPSEYALHLQKKLEQPSMPSVTVERYKRFLGGIAKEPGRSIGQEALAKLFAMAMYMLGWEGEGHPYIKFKGTPKETKPYDHDAIYAYYLADIYEASAKIPALESMPLVYYDTETGEYTFTEHRVWDILETLNFKDEYFLFSMDDIAQSAAYHLYTSYGISIEGY